MSDLKTIRIMSPCYLWSWIRCLTSRPSGSCHLATYDPCRLWPKDHPKHLTLLLMIMDYMTDWKTIRIMSPCYLWTWIIWLTGRPSGSCHLATYDHGSDCDLKAIRIMSPCYFWSLIICLTWRPSRSCHLATYDHGLDVWPEGNPDHVTLVLMIVVDCDLRTIQNISPCYLWS